jgi:hypothetical protein
MNILVFKVFEFLYSMLHFRSTKKAEKIIAERAQFDLFDFKQVSIPFERKKNTLQNELQLYGTAVGLCAYAKKKKIRGDIKIEHGLFLGGFVLNSLLNRLLINVHVTFSDYRKEILVGKFAAKRIEKIGPYIHYMRPYLNDAKHKDLKCKLGKTLLVFPSHTIPGVEQDFDSKCFIEEIISIRDQYSFDTVLICFYWNDIQNNFFQKFEGFGFLFSCAGHRYDDNFLRRLRTLIELSDSTISNKMGTHLGYCIYLNKPHYIFLQEVQIKSEKTLRSDVEINLTEMELNDFNQKFGFYSEQILEEQRKIANKYFGFDQIKSSDELRKLKLFR